MQHNIFLKSFQPSTFNNNNNIVIQLKSSLTSLVVNFFGIFLHAQPPPPLRVSSKITFQKMRTSIENSSKCIIIKEIFSYN